jgi:hypothetical protein
MADPEVSAVIDAITGAERLLEEIHNVLAHVEHAPRLGFEVEMDADTGSILDRPQRLRGLDELSGGHADGAAAALVGERRSPADGKRRDGGFGHAVRQKIHQEICEIDGVGESFRVRPVRFVDRMFDDVGMKVAVGKPVEGDDMQALGEKAAAPPSARSSLAEDAESQSPSPIGASGSVSGAVSSRTRGAKRSRFASVSARFRPAWTLVQ